MKKAYGYTKCEYEDLNPFDNCTPVNCELKYFGKRNFFKHPHCIAATTCENHPDVIYDYGTNECRNYKKIFTDEEIEKMKAGNFTNWVEGYENNNNNYGDAKIDANYERKARILRRVRRSLNESQTFADMLISTSLFIIKVVVLIIFIYLMMALLISILFYLCIGCGMISTSITMNTFERIN